MKSVLRETTQYQWFKSRGLTDFAGWVQFFQEWHSVAERLYDGWQHHKIIIQNPHDNWSKAYEEMVAFLQIERSPQ